MRGVSSEPKPYVLKQDQDLPKEEQTTFWLKPLKSTEASAITTAILSSRRSDRRGGDKWDTDKYAKADWEQFKAVVTKVENYMASEDFAEIHKQGFRNFEDPASIKIVYEDLPNDVIMEILEAANIIHEELTGTDLGKSHSKSTLSSGEAQK